jgi:2-polyprenyl-3-methyl-5-hydroxy-6-metoxy-1,4-benzoquinol methylase
MGKHFCHANIGESIDSAKSDRKDGDEAQDDATNGTLSQDRTLEALSNASAYNDWIYSIFENFVGQRVLEIGCGTGNLTRYLLEKANHVTAIDIDDRYIGLLSRTVRASGNRTLIVKKQNFLTDLTGLSAYDTVVLINVLEHLDDPVEALRRIYGILNPGGRVVVLVPALQWLFSPFDLLIGHRRRYTRSMLAAQLKTVGYQIDKNIYFNLLGIAAWWLRFCVLKKKYFTPSAVGLFNSITPLLRKIESLTPPPVGLSVIAVARTAM